jgi:hypothetical protein
MSLNFVLFTPSETLFHQIRRLPQWMGIKPLALSAVFGLATSCFAAPSLRCDVTYAGLKHHVKAVPVTDPYTVQGVDILGRFLFKPVLLEAQGKLSHVLVYVYLKQEPRPLILQQAKYLGPFFVNSEPYSLTGEQHVYGGPIERELIYNCWLWGLVP